ncbi:MAG TPA: glycine cleavage system protein GcvH [Syntrophomonas sp.]|jgi:glycine cleavage system H protein|nr:glycine cleavage system protein GcvH [Syntrophomonas sp.]
MRIPEELLYTKDHEWVKVEGQKVWIGITDFAQEHLGDIVFVELPEVDTEVEAGNSVAVIESVKAVSSVYSAVAGTVAEANAELEEAPEKLNEEPYENWILAVEMSNSDGLQGLMNAAAYEQLCLQQEEEQKGE